MPDACQTRAHLPPTPHPPHRHRCQCLQHIWSAGGRPLSCAVQQGTACQLRHPDPQPAAACRLGQQPGAAGHPQQQVQQPLCRCAAGQLAHAADEGPSAAATGVAPLQQPRAGSAEQAAPCLEVSRVSSWQSVALHHLQAVQDRGLLAAECHQRPSGGAQALHMADCSSVPLTAGSHPSKSSSNTSSHFRAAGTSGRLICCTWQDCCQDACSKHCAGHTVSCKAGLVRCWARQEQHMHQIQGRGLWPLPQVSPMCCSDVTPQTSRLLAACLGSEAKVV